MSRFNWRYVGRRFFLLILVIWTAVTINFFIPKITPRNPLREKLMEQASRGGYIEEGFDEMVAAYEARFGLDQPLWRQYINYLTDVARGDLGFSIANYPATVVDLVGQALPWTMGLLSVTTILAFLIGTWMGAVMAWPKSSNFMKYVFPQFLILGAIPAYVVALILIYFIAFQWKLLPLAGGYSIGQTPRMDWAFVLDILRHSLLPAFALLLTTIGGWVIGMRGMMVTVQGEDYMTFGEAKGLKDQRLFMRYGVRNAILPQVTGLALVLGHLIAGAVLVEVVFQYPGIGTLLWRAIRETDYFLVQGIVFFSIVTIGLATLILDIVYPLLDPRISYEKKG